MRKFLTACLATAALAFPALSAGPDEDGPKSQHRRGGQSSGQSSDSGASDDGARGSRSDGGARERPRFERSAPDGGGFQPRSLPSWSRRGMESGGSAGEADSPRASAKMRRRDEDVARPRIEVDGDAAAAARTPVSRGPKIVRPPHDGDTTASTPGTGRTATLGGRQEQHKQWTRHWRDNTRYDWRHHRERNRSLFRLGIYLDPYGYQYRRWMVGWSMRPYYYRSVYWLDDPWRYHLPDVWGPYQWVRYYDDALLVNTWTGEVVDVIYNFFW